MNALIGFFEHLPSWARSAILVGGLATMWIAESFFPHRKLEGNKLQHAALNIFFTITTAIVNLLAAILLVLLCDWQANHRVGLFFLVDIPLWLYLLTGLMVMDFFGAWLIHYLQHQIRWMWKVHRIHHIDTAVDSTTALRHHPIESLFRISMLFVVVFTFGFPLWMVMLYQSLSVLMSQFNHSNLGLPAWLDKGISWLIVSPNMHKVHHSRNQPETDSNYANIFSIWDRLFGTFVKVEDPLSISYGLDEFQKKEDNRITNLLKNPFKK